MTITIPLPSQEAEPLATALFAALQVERALTGASSASTVIAPSRLFAYANGMIASDPGVDAALAADPRLAATFTAMLDRAAPWRLPRLAAASAGTATVRTGENCRIELRTSAAEPSQVYVIIELAAPESAPSRLFVARAGAGVVSAELPPARDGTIQLLSGADAPLVAALRDVGAEIYLR
jgi:hypothetical protein